ncbi:MAG: hypothetical protein HYY52_06940 [Candidatus Melainabacteria bacterium]|nr:hypothetical protein [Candidatus Melainabacteria bacterium]
MLGMVRINNQTLSLAEIRSRKDIPPVDLCISQQVEEEDAEWEAQLDPNAEPLDFENDPELKRISTLACLGAEEAERDRLSDAWG